MVMAMMTLRTEPRVSAISAIASRIGGIDINPSMIRITTPSTERMKPDTSPMTRPISDARNATEKPTSRETCAP